jgi:predicted O-methyltransferase YrrM
VRTPDYPSADSARWGAVDGYFADLLAPHDDVLDEVLANNAHAGLPRQDVSATQGKLLSLLVRMVGARRVLEIGTLGGYSTIWIARALADHGRVVTIESNPAHAAVARRNFERAQIGAKIELQVGAAAEVLLRLAGPFDLFFIDADKPNNPVYLDWALRLARVGSVIVADNVVRGGAVVDEHSADANVRGVRQYLEAVSKHPRLESTALQTVGEKGWDGFAISIVKA